MPNMPSDRGRTFNGQQHVVLFHSSGTCSWIEMIDARRALLEHPAEWSKEPFAGKTYGAPTDAYAVEIYRHGGNGAGLLERPSGW